MHDYLIVGNGLAGSVLSYRLLEAGKSLIIIDKDNPNAAWKVAGGIWNAITFKRIIKGWNADTLTEEAQKFYPDLEKKWGLKFYEKKEIVRIFSDIHFQNTWLSKSSESPLTNYLDDDSPDELKDLPLNAPFGSGTVKNGGYVDLQLFMPHLRDILREKASYIDADFDFKQLEIQESKVIYGPYEAKNIIFCEGHQLTSNPYFSWLPLKPTKGETLILKNPGWTFKSILNNGKHLIDHGDGTMGVGATYSWSDLDEIKTEEGRDSLLKHLEKNFNFSDWEVLDQKAGIRPTVADRRPLVGQHPEHKNMFVFNGLGTKGVLTVPWLSKIMLEHLLEGKDLPEDCSISRFEKKHFR